MMKRIIIVLLVIINSFSVLAQDRSSLVSALNSAIVEVNYSNTADNLQNLEFIGQLVKDKKIIALGEATHGTLEHFLFKDRMIRYLILNQNLKRIAFESDMAGLERVNQFVLNPADQSNLEKILVESGLFDFYRTKEVIEMITWVKDYNKDKPESEKVHFQGMDIQYQTKVLNLILQTPKLHSLLNQEEKRSLKSFASLFETGFAAEVPEDLLKKVSSLSQSIAKGIKNFGTKDSLEIYSQYIVLLEQCIKLSNKRPYVQAYYRDQFMADNIEWIANQTLSHQKIAVWAHNSHISKGTIRSYKAMGNWLDKTFGDDYYALALLVGEGSATLFDSLGKSRKLINVQLPPLSNVNSIEYLFSKAKYENFFFDIQKAGDSGIFGELFKGDLFIRAIGPIIIPTTDIKFDLKNNFDGMVFFRQTSGATLN